MLYSIKLTHLISGCNIGCKTLFSKRGKMPLNLKLTCPAGTSTCPAGTSTCPAGTSTCPAGTSTCPAGTSTCPAGTSTCPAWDEIGLCPKHYLPSGASQGLVQLARPIAIYLLNSLATCNGASGNVARWLWLQSDYIVFSISTAKKFAIVNFEHPVSIQKKIERKLLIGFWILIHISLSNVFWLILLTQKL